MLIGTFDTADLFSLSKNRVTVKICCYFFHLHNSNLSSRLSFYWFFFLLILIDLLKFNLKSFCVDNLQCIEIDFFLVRGFICLTGEQKDKLWIDWCIILLISTGLSRLR